MDSKSKTQNPGPPEPIERPEDASHAPAVDSPPPASRFTFHVSRYLSIYAALWRNSVTRETMFKANFLLWIVVELLWFGLQLSFIAVLYLHTDQIGTWTKWQVVMLIGGSHFIQQLFQAFFSSIAPTFRTSCGLASSTSCCCCRSTRAL